MCVCDTVCVCLCVCVGVIFVHATILTQGQYAAGLAMDQFAQFGYQQPQQASGQQPDWDYSYYPALAQLDGPQNPYLDQLHPSLQQQPSTPHGGPGGNRLRYQSPQSPIGRFPPVSDSSLLSPGGSTPSPPMRSPPGW